jgi:hypothetical protein
MHARSLRVSDLVLGLLQTGQDRLLAVRSATTQPLLQNLDRRRLQEEEASVEVGLLHLLDALEIMKVSNMPIPSHLTTHQTLQHHLKLTSISISKMQVLPLSLTSLTACTLVP